MPECRRCGCDIAPRRDCPFCGHGQGSDELARLHGWHRLFQAGLGLAVLLALFAFAAYIVPQLSYDPRKAMADPRMVRARDHLRHGNADAAHAVLEHLSQELWFSGLPDAFLAATCHLRYEKSHDDADLEAMAKHLESSLEKERSLPQTYFAAVYAAETGQLEKANEGFSSCHKTLTMPGHPWESFLDRGTVNGNLGRWKVWIGKKRSAAKRPEVLHGL